MRRTIAIDPDKDKSGFAVLDGKTLISVGVARFPDLLTMIEKECSVTECSVVVEAGWLEPANWHVKRGDTPSKAAAIGRALGQNQQTGMLLVEWCRMKGYDVTEMRPLRKMWRGRDGKVTQTELEVATRLRLPRMNQDARDALLLGWVYNNNPVRAYASAWIG